MNYEKTIKIMKWLFCLLVTTTYLPSVIVFISTDVFTKHGNTG